MAGSEPARLISRPPGAPSRFLQSGRQPGAGGLLRGRSHSRTGTHLRKGAWLLGTLRNVPDSLSNDSVDGWGDGGSNPKLSQGSQGVLKPRAGRAV